VVALAAAVGVTGVTLLLVFASYLWQPAVFFFLIGAAGAWGMADRSIFRRRWLQLLTQKVSAAAAGVAMFAALVIVAEWVFALLKL
jgi:hypothetical protein